MQILPPEAGRLTVRYLPPGHLEVGCTFTGDTAVISAADMEGMLAEIKEFVVAHPCCSDSRA